MRNRPSRVGPASEEAGQPAFPPPSSGSLFLLWFSIGFQSFGGGVATLALIRRRFVERSRWLTEEEFTQEWALCQMAPGINLLALTTLIGHRVAGVRGILVSLLGLLLPSAAVTVLLTAFYARVRSSPVIDAGLRGVVPATVGLGLLTAWQMTRPILAESRREGRGTVLFSLLLLGGSAMARAFGASSTAVLLAAAAVSAVAHWGRRVRRARTR